MDTEQKTKGELERMRSKAASSRQVLVHSYMSFIVKCIPYEYHVVCYQLDYMSILCLRTKVAGSILLHCKCIVVLMHCNLCILVVM